MGLLDVIRRDRAKAPAIDLREVYDASIRDLPEPRFPDFDKQLSQAIEDYTALDNVKKGEIFQFEEARRREPDFYLPYFWVATYHMEHKNYPSAIEVLREGIAKSRIKSVLCRRLGECYFWSRDMEKAVYWFCTAIMAGDQVDYNVYLYLGYMYDAYGMKEPSCWARRRARGISYQLTYMAIEYVKKDMDRIREVALEHRTDRTAQMMASFYPYAKKVLGNL